MKQRPPLDSDQLVQVLSVRPARVALDKLLDVVPHVPGPGDRYNDLHRDLNLVSAISLSIAARHGLALIIDYEGEEYDIIIEVLEHYGARATATYLREGQTACGGVIPRDEIARVELALKHEAELDALDRQYQPHLGDEAAECFVLWLSQNIGAALKSLNQTHR